METPDRISVEKLLAALLVLRLLKQHEEILLEYGRRCYELGHTKAAAERKRLTGMALINKLIEE